MIQYLGLLQFFKSIFLDMMTCLEVCRWLAKYTHKSGIDKQEIVSAAKDLNVNCTNCDQFEVKSTQEQS